MLVACDFCVFQTGLWMKISGVKFAVNQRQSINVHDVALRPVA